MNLIEGISKKPTSLGILFDPAHGKDVAGKRSPDEEHREYLWSRNMIKDSIDLISSLKSNRWDILYPYSNEVNEPGIRTRVDTYNAIAMDYDLLIVLSLHNDAFKNPPAWWSGPGGFTLFTSRGETIADPICTFIGESMAEKLPQERFRFDFGLSKNEKIRDLDREANFGVITGYNIGKETEVLANYAGILIENNFMDVREDYKKLISPVWNNNLSRVYTTVILNLATKLGFDNCLDEVLIKPE